MQVQDACPVLFSVASHLAYGVLEVSPAVTGSKCVGWGLLPSTHVLIETHKEVQSGNKSGTWAEEKVATNIYAKASHKGHAPLSLPLLCSPPFVL